ncbi:MAG: hypothetical protein IAF02_04095 [Anaerolineae bacterium]|nr:hypothetical protein [Anaerolineae bacterium]
MAKQAALGAGKGAAVLIFPHLAKRGFKSLSNRHAGNGRSHLQFSR